MSNKLYGSRRFLKGYVDNRVYERIESREGIIWSIDEDKQVCYVKIQNSDTSIVAHFPRNWKTIPYWLKPRMAVRIGHLSGNRGYIEVLGEGRAIPEPTAGEVMPPLA